MAPSEQLAYQVDTLTKLVANVRPDQMNAPTPCTEWDMRALLNHFVGGAGMFAAAFNGEDVQIESDGPGPDLVGDDPLGAWHAGIAAFNSAVDEPGAVDRMIALPFGTMPGGVVLEILKFDLTVHCWDVAKATGQTFEPPDDVVAHADAVARQMLTPEMRGGGAFGPEVTPPGDATPIERLVAFTGRSV
jgi:uncharacterized protein (TIGR03086 family)